MTSWGGRSENWVTEHLDFPENIMAPDQNQKYTFMYVIRYSA